MKITPPKIKEDPNNEDYFKIEDNLKKKVDLKSEDDLKIKRIP